MKLAFVILRYFPFGGLQRDMLRIAHACLQQGHTVDIYTQRIATLNTTPPSNEIVYPQIQKPLDNQTVPSLFRWPTLSLKPTHYTVVWPANPRLTLTVKLIKIRAISNHQRAKKFYKAIRKPLQNYHLVIGFNKMPQLDIYFAGEVCFKSACHSKWYYRLTSRYRHYCALERAVFGGNTAIMALTRKQCQAYHHCYNTPWDCFHLLPPGIDKNILTDQEMVNIRAVLRCQLHFKEDEVMLLLVASNFKTKGLDRILLAMAQLVHLKIRLVIIGGDNPHKYQQLAKALSLQNTQVVFLGTKTNSHHYMLAADVLVHPARTEAAGMVLLEALTMGLPVIASDNCGYAFHIKKAKAGLILPSPFQLTKLVWAIKDMLNNHRRLAYKTHAFYYANTVDLYSMTKKAMTVIEDCGKRDIKNRS